MDASRYKDYMLGLMFYKFLSDNVLETFRREAGLGKLSQSDVLKEYTKQYEKDKGLTEEAMKAYLGYSVSPKNLYQTWLEDIHKGSFAVQQVTDSLNDFERSIGVVNGEEFKGLFSSSIMDMTNNALGEDLNKRSKSIRNLILLFEPYNMMDLAEGDVLGDAYEYLIGEFASGAGKKAGEFYTPHEVSEIMAQIVAKTAKFNNIEPTIYDPTVGSASLLLTVRKHLSHEQQKNLHYYGQEYITETYNLTRMNLLLHGVKSEKMTIKNGNTLAQDWPENPNRPNEPVLFDAVVMNPPYSDKSWNDKEERPLTISDPRFSDFGVLPPDSKGDYAYLMHGLYHLEQNGTMAIVLPHGVLFRGGTEGEIRKKLLEKNQIDAIIGLPSNMFANTGIPVCVLILKKNRPLGEDVLLIDASSSFVKIGKQNVLEEKDIAKIVDTYLQKNEIAGFSHRATRKEIIENDYNLNIPRYVEKIDDEIAHDVEGHLHGGIPKKNIAKLKVLNEEVGDIINNNIEEVRPGYVELKLSPKEINNLVLDDNRIKEKIKNLDLGLEDFAKKWYEELKTTNDFTKLSSLKEKMLVELKNILSPIRNIEVYAGYQILARIWKNILDSDLELIAKAQNHYEVARGLEPNMVTTGQGKNKKTEQKGLKGTLIPSELVKENLYKEELALIEEEKAKIEEINASLEEIRDSLSEEDGEYRILNDKNEEFASKEVTAELKDAYNKISSKEIQILEDYVLFLGNKPKKDEKLDFIAAHSEVEWNKVELNKDGTANKTKVNNRLKQLRAEYVFEKDSFEEKLAIVSSKLEQKKEIEKELKAQEKALQDKSIEKIKELSEEEVDLLLYKKWFETFPKDVSALIEVPLKKELAILEELKNRYSTTLEEIDNKLTSLEDDLAKMLADLEVINND